MAMSVRPRDGGISLVMLLLAGLVLYGAWREVAHHDGLLLVVVPAALMPAVVAALARRQRRGPPR